MQPNTISSERIQRLETQRRGIRAWGRSSKHSRDERDNNHPSHYITTSLRRVWLSRRLSPSGERDRAFHHERELAFCETLRNLWNNLWVSNPQFVRCCSIGAQKHRSPLQQPGTRGAALLHQTTPADRITTQKNPHAHRCPELKMISCMEKVIKKDLLAILRNVLLIYGKRHRCSIIIILFLSFMRHKGIVFSSRRPKSSSWDQNNLDG